jgi:hypothetical protein
MVGSSRGAIGVEPDTKANRIRLPGRAPPGGTPWWGLGRFVFAQRVKGFWTAGPASIPVKREIYPMWLEHSE